MNGTTTTVPEIDRIVTTISDWLVQTPPDGGAQLALSRQDVQWLLGEIEGGREAFGTLVATNAGLRQEVGKLRRTVDTLMTMRDKPNG